MVKNLTKLLRDNKKKYNLSKEFNRFATITVANSEAGDLDVTGLGEAKIVKTTFKTKGRGLSGVVKRWNFAGGEVLTDIEWVEKTVQLVTVSSQGRVQPGKKNARTIREYKCICKK